MMKFEGLSRIESENERRMRFDNREKYKKPNNFIKFKFKMSNSERNDEYSCILAIVKSEKVLKLELKCRISEA